MVRVIGLSGFAGCGKTTVARYLIEQWGFVRVRFADPLKDMLRVVDLNDRHLDGDLKETPCDILGDRTPRSVLQELGTDFFRNRVSPNFWVNAWKRRVQAHMDMEEYIVADDVRFPNEAAAIFHFGGALARITRPDNTLDVGKHESEAYIESIAPDVHLINDGTLNDLFRKVDFRLIRGVEIPYERAA